jgi:transcriptional antiterminator NusG
VTEKLPSDLDYSTAAEQSSEEDEAQEGNVLEAELHSVDAIEHSAMHVIDESDEPNLDGLLDALDAAVYPEADAIVDDALDIDSVDEADAAVEATHDESGEDDTV